MSDRWVGTTRGLELEATTKIHFTARAPVHHDTNEVHEIRKKVARGGRCQESAPPANAQVCAAPAAQRRLVLVRISYRERTRGDGIGHRASAGACTSGQLELKDPGIRCLRIPVCVYCPSGKRSEPRGRTPTLLPCAPAAGATTDRLACLLRGSRRVRITRAAPQSSILFEDSSSVRKRRGNFSTPSTMTRRSMTAFVLLPPAASHLWRLSGARGARLLWPLGRGMSQLAAAAAAAEGCKDRQHPSSPWGGAARCL